MKNEYKQNVVKKADEIYSEIDNFFGELTDEEKRVMFLEAYGCFLGYDSGYKGSTTDDFKEIFKIFKKSDNTKKKIIATLFLRGMLFDSSQVFTSLNEMKCSEEGHKYGEWKEYRSTEFEYYKINEYCNPDNPWYNTYGKREIEIVKWIRFCKICGERQITDKEPYLTDEELGYQKKIGHR